MMLFIAGFVCANSGWAPTLSILLSDRPEWSVCGEDLCLCVQPSTVKPACALCSTGTKESTCTSAEGQSQDTPPNRVPRSPDSDAITQAGDLGSVSIFIAFVIGHARSQQDVSDPSLARFAEPDACIALSNPDIPSPPPRS
jgi:hypothetical protein